MKGAPVMLILLSHSGTLDDQKGQHWGREEMQQSGYKTVNQTGTASRSVSKITNI